MKNITTILFDIGWPIIDETILEVEIYKYLIGQVQLATGREFSMAEIRNFEQMAVASYAPSAISCILWEMTQPDQELFHAVRDRFSEFDINAHCRLQPGIRQLLKKLSSHFKLGIAANQRSSVKDYLEQNDILKYFQSTGVSEDLNFSKPDPRLFAAVLEQLDSSPSESLMVGDRQDNDIAPAKLLGMTAVLLRVGPHKNQLFRYPYEAPDYEIDKIEDMAGIPLIANKLI
ncbi:MAG: HAD family hydrolase [Candidatus Zixiibacteriota bacterium]